MDKKFCTSCQKQRDVEGGKMITSSSNIKRWKCAACLARKSNALYTSKKATNETD
jgi:hypothetical protein